MVAEEARLSQETGAKTRQRLAAILAADAAGYSRLMSADEQGTMVALDAARAVFREGIESHNGRVVDMAGDSVLAVFETATGAVSAALDVQQKLEAFAAGVLADRQMRFRIGVHLGDVNEKADGTVYGDGVNIAARLEGLALPGGVAVSDAVRGAVRHRLGVEFEDLGEQQVKNIADPVRAYRVHAATSRGVAAKSGPRAVVLTLASVQRRWVAIAAFAGLAALLGMAAWLQVREPMSGTAPITMSLGLGSIATPANDPISARAAETTAQSLVTGLGAVERSVRVVSIARRMDSTAMLHEVARTAGARYVVEGDLQVASRRRVLNLRLINTGRGTLAWSERFDLPEEGSVESQIANRKVIGQLARAVARAEIDRVLPMPVHKLDAMELIVRAWALLDQGTSVEVANDVRKLTDDALRREPTLVPALLAVTYALDTLNNADPVPNRDRYVREKDEYSARAVTLEPDNPDAWDQRASALMRLGRWNASLEASERQLRLDPYASRSYDTRAWLLNMMGRPAEALPLIEKALALNLSDGRGLLRSACEAHLLSGDFGSAITTCERASGLDTGDFVIHLFLAAAYANSGDFDHARDALNTMLRIFPGYTIAQLRAKRYSDHLEYQKLAEQYWYAGLRKAGLAEK